MQYEIVTYPNKILEQKCEEVKFPLSSEEEDLLNQMFNYLKNNPTAVGLAAPQFGVAKRLIAIRHKDPETGKTFCCKMVNPKIVSVSSTPYYVFDGESCLSEPDLKVKVKRHKEILLSGYDTITKSKVTYRLSNFRAAIAQHEVDHLNGILLHMKEKEAQQWVVEQ